MRSDAKRAAVGAASRASGGASQLDLLRSIEHLTGTYGALRKTVHAVRRARESTGRNTSRRASKLKGILQRPSDISREWQSRSKNNSTALSVYEPMVTTRRWPNAC
jgi:hypothetical protein